MQIKRQHSRPATCQHVPLWPSLWIVTIIFTSVLLASSQGIFAQTQEPSEAADASTDKQSAAEKTEQQKEAEQRKPPLEIGPLRPRFGEESVDAVADEGPTLALKPGHWTATYQPMQANFNDFIGRFAAELVDDNRQAVALEHSRFGLRVSRDVTLVKGKEREIEGELFLPQRTEATRLRAQLVDRDSGADVFLYQPKLERIPAYQYNIVVLAKEPERYAFLKVTNTVRAPWEKEFAESSRVHYQVTLAKVGAEVPLPENPFTWTSVAYIIWDEVDPMRFSVAQQQALLDWLHWGGRLIVNGPDSLASLKGSFLEPFLPAEDGGPREFTAEDLLPLSAYWGRRESGTAIAPLKPSQPLSGIALKLRAGSVDVAGAEALFCSRNVGRGAITVSALQLSERDFINWPGFDGFLNGGLLQRPRRIFSAGLFGATQVDWVDFNQRRLDAHFTTPLRLFARDAQAQANTRQTTIALNQPAGPFPVTEDPTELSVDRPGGIAGWDEFSPVAQVARELLLVAAGVQVPGAGFVLGTLAFYLLVLVPVNWLVFYTINRVEWAWIAVPFLAVLGTWAIVKQAQLDIGFVRAQTEVAILELQGANDRGVLTRFTAMYSSLSTTYEIEFPDEQAALVLPFPANDSDPTDLLSSVVFDESSAPRLDGLTVASSATRLIHAEQILQLDGPLRLGTSSRGLEQVENRSQLALRDVAVVRRTFDAAGKTRYEGCWLGELKGGRTVVLGMKPLALEPKKLPFALEREAAAEVRVVPTMSVDPLLQLAFLFENKHDPLSKEREETRLVGVIDEAVPGMEILPEASQRKGVTVVIAHLEYGPLATRQPDVNSPADVVTSTETDESP
ncbi:MAG: hypothetical protein SH868_06375 [Bythopirellula sp.]|nr:hypothetical protein [Bythopirellula sp.]